MENVKVKRVTSKHGDAEVITFKIYNDSDFTAYSVTMVDAYRTPWVKIMSQQELDNFLKEF